MNKTLEYFIEKYLAKVKANFHPKEMWIWGSQVWGTPNENSDIDIMLVSNVFQNRRFIIRGSEVARKLQTWSDKSIPDIDFLCYTPEEYEKKKQQVSLAKEIVKKGVKII